MPRLRKDFLYYECTNSNMEQTKKGFRQDIMLLSGILPHTKKVRGKEPQKEKKTLYLMKLR